MFTSLFFYIRVLFPWVVLLVAILMVVSGMRGRIHPQVFFVWCVAMVFVLTSATSHLRRVRLIIGKANASTLANRQRRQIEMPMEATQAFDIVDAAIRELPHVENVESARDSLQIRAKVRRIHPYGATSPFMQRLNGWFAPQRNQIFATVTPHDSTGSVNLVCEPESGAWRDWLSVDNGTNLENAEAIGRAISRRIAEARRTEQSSAKATETEKELAVAKLRLLHAQVEPHFLYNTLGSAKYLVRSDPARAEQIIDNLILYLRHSLPRIENSLSTLGEELERVRAYLDIMQIRMGTRLNTEVNVPPALMSVPFPTMMLQTLVENAIKHGLEPKSGGGTIWILAVDKNGRVAITVADDGIGLGAQTTGSSIGLKNVRERLELAYGADAAVRPRRQLSGRGGRDHHRAHRRAARGGAMTKPVTGVIAEDEALFRDALVGLLREEWPALEIVATCEDGGAALEAIGEHRPDVAFLDIRMPGLTGLEVAAASAEVEPGHADRVRHRLRPVRDPGVRARRGRLPAEADPARTAGGHDRPRCRRAGQRRPAAARRWPP